MLRAIIRPLSLLALTSLLAVALHPIFLFGAGIMAMDCRGRWIDFNRLRRLPFNANRAAHMQSTWCSRGVAEAIWPEARKYYAARGYRAWHVVPDDFPFAFLDPAFWRSVLGVHA